MPNQQLRLDVCNGNSTNGRKQVVLTVQNVDPVNPVAQFVPEQCRGEGPFDINLASVTGGNAEEVAVRVVLAQENLAFMPNGDGITAGCDVSQSYLTLLSPPEPEAREIDFLVAPLGPDTELQFNIGLVATGRHKDCGEEQGHWRLPVIIDPKIRNLT